MDRIIREAVAMRGFLVMAMFVASLLGTTWDGFNVDVEFTVDARAADAFDIGEQFVTNSWGPDESPVIGPAQAIDAPCTSRHVASDIYQPVTDIT
jgi:hypothetical protein